GASPRMNLRGVHRPPITEREPAPHDPVNEPEADDRQREPGDENTDSECCDDEEQTEANPEQPVPECPNLPPEVRLEPRTAHVSTLHVVQYNRNQRRPSGQERPEDCRGPDDARDQAEPMQRINRLGPIEQWARGTGVEVRIRHASIVRLNLAT